MSVQRIRVAIVGVGGIARGEHIPAWLTLPFAEVVAFADPLDEARRLTRMILPAAREYSDWREMLQKEALDAVDICTPNSLHAPIALESLRQGHHVLCEKPLCTSTGDALQLRDAAAQSSAILMTAQSMRFRPSSMQIRKLIDRGILGEIYYTRAQWLRRRRLPISPTFIVKTLGGGGPCLDIGVHVLDIACWFMGNPDPVAVSAAHCAALAPREDLTGDWGDWNRVIFSVEDFATAYVRFANGATLTLESSWLAFQPDAETIRVQCYGKQGGLVYPEGIITGETDRVPWTMKVEQGDDKGAYRSEVRAFAEAIRDGRPSPVPIAETLNVIRIIEACYESARLGSEVRLDVQPVAAGGVS